MSSAPMRTSYLETPLKGPRKGLLVTCISCWPRIEEYIGIFLAWQTNSTRVLESEGGHSALLAFDSLRPAAYHIPAAIELWQKFFWSALHSGFWRLLMPDMGRPTWIIFHVARARTLHLKKMFRSGSDLGSHQTLHKKPLCGPFPSPSWQYNAQWTLKASEDRLGLNNMM